ncbi:hypothetical protein ACFLT7_06230 [candidate division KSB1 bacterium]
MGISRTWASITLLPVFYLFVLPHPAANALELQRSLVQDTLVIPIADPEGLQPLQLSIDSLLDQRPEPGPTLGRYEKNNYLIIPVDLLLRSEKPLADHLTTFLPAVPSEPGKSSISLAVEYLRLDKKTNSMFYPHYRLNAAVRVISNAGGEPDNLGTLVYDCALRKPAFGDKLERGIASAVGLWGKELYDDLSITADNPSLDRFSTLENFRLGASAGKPINMLTGLEFYVGGGADGYWTATFASPPVRRESFFTGAATWSAIGGRKILIRLSSAPPPIVFTTASTAQQSCGATPGFFSGLTAGTISWKKTTSYTTPS